MAIQVGEKIPNVTIKTSGMKDISTGDLCAGKKVVLFSVPGAFTPTCSQDHFPGFIKNTAEIKSKGVDVIACMSVNDCFVMDAWAKQLGAGEDITLLADGNAEFATALGLTMDGSGFGLGTRAQRFAMIIEDGVVKHMGVEDPTVCDLSSGEKILEAL